MNFYAGCVAVLLFAALVAAGVAAIVAQALLWLQSKGVEPGAVVLLAVLVFALFSLLRAIGNRTK